MLETDEVASNEAEIGESIDDGSLSIVTGDDRLGDCTSAESPAVIINKEIEIERIPINDTKLKIEENDTNTFVL